MARRKKSKKNKISYKVKFQKLKKKCKLIEKKIRKIERKSEKRRLRNLELKRLILHLNVKSTYQCHLLKEITTNAYETRRKWTVVAKDLKKHADSLVFKNTLNGQDHLASSSEESTQNDSEESTQNDSDESNEDDGEDDA